MARRRRPGSSHADPFEPLAGPVTDTLDLHGFRASEVRSAVIAFVNRVRRSTPDGLVHIITGRGRGSPGPPVVKSTVKSLLQSGSLPVRAWGEDLNGGGFLIRLQR